MTRQALISAAAVLCWPILTAASCATTRAPEPTIVTQRVEIPVAVPCAADPGPDPAYADANPALQAAADLYDRVRLLLAGRDQRQARELELKAAVAGCRPPP